MVDRLQWRAAEQPDETVFHLITDRFFEDGPAAAPSITYGELHQQAAATAATLRERLQPGDRVVLPFAPGLEFMPALYGCLYAGLVPVPVYPPMRGLQADPLAGLRRIVADCQPLAVLTGGKSGSGILKMAEEDPLLRSIWWLSMDSIEESSATDWQHPDTDEHALALLQYTSGSTGTPRGVAVTHRNLISNNRLIERAFHHQTDVSPQRGVCWLPFHHDMGLIGNVLHPVFADIPVYFMTPLDFLRRPLQWLQAVSKLGPVTSGGPGFAYDLCVRKVTEEQKQTLDLSEWKIAYIGADKVTASTIRGFCEAFAECGLRPESLYPCYGLAESTLFVTGGHWDAAPVIRRFIQQQNGESLTMIPGSSPDDVNTVDDSGEGRELVGCGHMWKDQEVAVVDPGSGRRVAEGQVGEIWTTGSSTASGYWNQPDTTAEVFGGQIVGESELTYLRTGDLGFFSDGELFVTGRRKDVIIIRGRNYHPEDIESLVARRHDTFRPESTAAVGVEDGGEERLVILQEVDRKTVDFDLQQMSQVIRQSIAEEFQIQVSRIEFLQSGSLPKTSSGKIRRFACREHYEAGTLQPWKGTVR